MDKFGDFVYKGHTSLKDIGQKGEDLACGFLKKHGFRIICRNYRRKWGEIDIVAEKSHCLHFVEVKTVSREKILDNDYEPEDNIHPWKRQRLRRIIGTYLAQHDTEDDWQIDALAVYLNPRQELLKIELLEDIIL